MLESTINRALIPREHAKAYARIIRRYARAQEELTRCTSKKARRRAQAEFDDAARELMDEIAFVKKVGVPCSGGLPWERWEARR